MIESFVAFGSHRSGLTPFAADPMRTKADRPDGPGSEDEHCSGLTFCVAVELRDGDAQLAMPERKILGT